MPSASKSRLLPRLAQGGHVAGGPVAEAEVGADDDRRGVQGVDEDPLDEPLRRPVGHLAGERHHEDVVDAGAAEQPAPASRWW